MSDTEETGAPEFDDVYEHLRALANNYFSGRPGQTLQPTALVHEAYLRLARSDTERFNSRSHFVATAATAMRQILTDAARRRTAHKRGGPDQERVSLSGVGDDGKSAVDVLALDNAMSRLEALSKRQARIVELRYFGGLTVPETAEALEVSTATVEKEWRRARAWLAKELQ